MTTMMTIPLYKSREDLTSVAPVIWSEDSQEIEGVTYDALCGLRNRVDDLDRSLAVLYDALYEDDEERSDESEAGVVLAREELVLHWAKTQMALSSLAALLAIDGNQAYQRLVNEQGMGGI